MIQEAFQYTRNIINQYITNKYGLDGTPVIANKIVDQSGAIPLENQNKVILSLIHVEHETSKPFYNRNMNRSEGDGVVSSPPEAYHIYMLVTSCFDDYNETLKFLDASIQFFQMYPSLDKSNSASIPDSIQKLTFEKQVEGGYAQMHNLWTAMGAKYQPSVVYKMRLITVPSDEIAGFDANITPISKPSTV